jgi:two-component system LytT family response regulator
MLNCYVVDDELHALNVISDYITRTPNIHLMGKSNDPIAALQQINELLPDVAFVDIEMPYLSGIEFSKLVKKEVTIVFTTAHPNFAVDAFDCGSYDFLLKPIKYERFLKSIQKITEMRKTLSLAHEILQHPQKDHIFIQSGLKGQMIRINLEDIVYIESLNNYIIIHLAHEKYIVYLTLKETIDTLPANWFSRIHKSIIVNDDKIKSIEGNRVIIDDKIKLAIGNTYRESFLEKISKNLVKRKLS